MDGRRLVVKPTESERKRGNEFVSFGSLLILLGVVSFIIAMYLFWSRQMHSIAILGVFFFIGLMVFGRALITQGQSYLRVRLSSTIDEMSPYEFEIFIADLFERMGYCTTNLRDSGDYGADVIAKGDKETVAIQVKHYSPGRKVGSKTIRDVYAGAKIYDAEEAAVVTTTYFTKPAVKTAEKLNVKLIDRKTLTKLVEKYYPEQERHG